MSKDEKGLEEVEYAPIELKPASGLPYLQQLVQKMRRHEQTVPLESEEINRAMWVIVTSSDININAIQQSIDCLWTLMQFGDIRRFSTLDLACLQTALDITINQAETVYKLGEIIYWINEFSEEPRRLSIPSLENVLLQLLKSNVNSSTKKKVLLAVGKVIQAGYYRDSLKKPLQPHWQGVVQQLALQAGSLTLGDIAHILYSCMLLGSLKRHNGSDHKPDDEFASAVQKLIDAFHEKLPITMPSQLNWIEFNQIIPCIQQAAEYLDYKHYQEGEPFEKNKNNTALRLKLQQYLDKRRPKLEPDSLPGKTFLKLAKKLYEDPRTCGRVICTAETLMGAYPLDIRIEFLAAKEGEKRFFNVEYDGRGLHYKYDNIHQKWRLRPPYLRRRTILLGSPWNLLIDIKHYQTTSEHLQDIEKTSEDHAEELYKLSLELALQFKFQKQPEEKQLLPTQRQAEIKTQVYEELVVEEESIDKARGGDAPPIKLECSCCRCKTSINDDELLTLAEQGVPQAQYLIALKYFDPVTNRATDPKKLISWLAQAVANENADAEILLAHCCRFGIGVSQNDTAAMIFQKRAANHGHVAAQYLLANDFRFGRLGVKEDLIEAVKWYREAANEGNANAQTGLGVCYENGVGVRQDVTEAVKLYQQATRQEFAEAQWRLGQCYRDGIGVKEDKIKAARLFRKAAKQGDCCAQHALGNCYDLGIGVGKDEAKAITWYKKSADQGYEHAQNNLGILYLEKGEPIEAFNWLQKAAQCSNLRIVEAVKENLRITAKRFKEGRNAHTKKSHHSSIICFHAAALLDEQKQTIRHTVDRTLTALLQDCYDAVEAYMSKKSSLGLDVYPHAALDFLLLIHSTAIALNNKSLRKKSAEKAIQLANNLSREAGPDKIKAEYYENVAYLSDEKNNQETEMHLPWLVKSFNSFNTIAVYPERWNIGQRLFELSQKCEILYKVKPTSAIKDQLFYIQVISLSAAAVKGHEKSKAHFNKFLSENLEACYAAAEAYENGDLSLALDGNLLKNLYRSMVSKASGSLKSKVIADAKRVSKEEEAKKSIENSTSVSVLKIDSPKIPLSLLKLYFDNFKQASPDSQESIANDLLFSVERNLKMFISSMQDPDFSSEFNKLISLFYNSGSPKIKYIINELIKKFPSELSPSITSAPASPVDAKDAPKISVSLLKLYFDEFKQASLDRQASIANELVSFVEENLEAFILNMEDDDFCSELDKLSFLIYNSYSPKIKSKIQELIKKFPSMFPVSGASAPTSAALPVSAVDSKPLAETPPSIVRLLIEVSDIYPRIPAVRTQQSPSDDGPRFGK